MNWMEFFSSLAWPGVILIIALNLKDPLLKLISTLAKIKYKDWEFEFALKNKLEKMEIVVSDSMDKIDRATNKSSQNDEKFAIGNNNSFVSYSPKVDTRFIKQFIRNLDKSIYQLYRVAYSKEHSLILNAVKKKEVIVMLEYLRDKDIISEDLFELIIQYRSIPDQFLSSVIPEDLELDFLNVGHNISEIIRKKTNMLHEESSSN
ncbi:hypothetical protein MOC93_18150 [Bacillus haynesii]|uniref:hypothetical protein n=1 Tax=Bacillus haynesii TaxID=1925021 RepID=UPI00227E3ACD|nr:hypothetical protein [Bacillus haynesii]MCY8438610.1 hypothetical protein [Bacillus haynesii]